MQSTLLRWWTHFAVYVISYLRTNKSFIKSIKYFVFRIIIHFQWKKSIYWNTDYRKWLNKTCVEIINLHHLAAVFITKLPRVLNIWDRKWWRVVERRRTASEGEKERGIKREGDMFNGGRWAKLSKMGVYAQFYGILFVTVNLLHILMEYSRICNS